MNSTDPLSMKKTLPDFVIQNIPQPPVEDPVTGWARKVWYLGSTRCMEELCIHSGVMSGKVTPHEIHTHDHEEIHITFSDNIQYTYRDPDSHEERSFSLRNGSIFFFDSEIPHNTRNLSNEPAQYLHIRWRQGTPFIHGKPGLHFDYQDGDGDAMAPVALDKGFGSREIYSGPSRFLPHLRVRYHKLSAGGVIPLHRHDHEVFIAIVEGSVEILGKTINAPGFAFMGTHVPHNTINHGSVPARFYGIEFHHGR
jgi:mannose-6-phosphate isomerase-like protein (cupin superfamily)